MRIFFYSMTCVLSNENLFYAYPRPSMSRHSTPTMLLCSDSWAVSILPSCSISAGNIPKIICVIEYEDHIFNESAAYEKYNSETQDMRLL